MICDRCDKETRFPYLIRGAALCAGCNSEFITVSGESWRLYRQPLSEDKFTKWLAKDNDSGEP